MAAPSIIVGLTTLTTSDADDGWENIGGGTPTLDSDFFIQGPTTGGAAIAARVSGTSGNGAFYYEITNAENGITSIDLSGEDHAFIWLYCTGFSNLTSINDATRPGLQVILVGTTNESNYSNWFVSGNENRVGGWRCYPVSGTQSPDAEVGTGIGNGSAVIGVVVEANSKGNAAGRNVAADAVRFGTGLTIIGGENPDSIPTAGPAGFTSITDVNDADLNKYGVFAAFGAGADLQGRLTIGQDNTTTETWFEDSNYAITNQDKNPRSGFGTFTTRSDFTGFSVVGTLTTCNITNVAFSSIDDYDKGYFTCDAGTNKPGDVVLDGCTFLNWGPTTLSGFTTALNTTWIGCEVITPNTGDIDNCTVETGVGGTYVCCTGLTDTISNVSFIGQKSADPNRVGLPATVTEGLPGYGHGLEFTSGGTYDFVGNTFVGFDTNGSDGAAIHINGGATGIAVTLNISGGGTFPPTFKLTPDVDTGGGVSTVTFKSSVVVNITGLPTPSETSEGSEIRILGAGTTNLLGVGTENTLPSDGIYTFSLDSNTNFDVRILNVDFVPFFLGGLTANTDPTNVPVDLKIDRVYNDSTPPTGE